MFIHPAPMHHLDSPMHLYSNGVTSHDSISGDTKNETMTPESCTLPESIDDQELGLELNPVWERRIIQTMNRIKKKKKPKHKL